MLEFTYLLITFGMWNLLLLILFLALIRTLLYRLKWIKKRRYGDSIKILSFIHPFCNDCGGGEKVLWRMIKSLTQFPQREKTRQVKINILAGVKDDSNSIKNKLKERFDIEFTRNSNCNLVFDIEIIRLKSADFLRPKKFLTMLLQILGQIIFAFEIITTVYSDVIIDTTGLPFTYSILSFIGRTQVNAYVHYPFISTDMINDVSRGIQGVHSRGFLSKYSLFRKIKVLYYYLILLLYRFNGLFLKFAFCNSTWTLNHIKRIWTSTTLQILFPPCSIQLYESNISNHNRKNIIVSFSQFRPEKNHKLQIDIFNKVKKKSLAKDLKLYIIGAVRDETDRRLFDELNDYIRVLNLSEDILLCPNVPFTEVKKYFEMSKIGIHTMRDEHFGISIIEMMAAGLIVIAHKSAGALNDIIGTAPTTVGILAENEDDYVEQIQEIVERYNSIQGSITSDAKKWVKKFSDEEFMKKFVEISFNSGLF